MKKTIFRTLLFVFLVFFAQPVFSAQTTFIDSIHLWGAPHIDAQGNYILYRESLDVYGPNSSTIEKSPVCEDLCLYNIKTKQYEGVNLSNFGEVPNSYTHNYMLSPDGQKILFTSNATNLVAETQELGAPGQYYGVYIYDRTNNTTKLITVDEFGTPYGRLFAMGFSGEGKQILLMGTLPTDGGCNRFVYIYDVESETFKNISIPNNGDAPVCYTRNSGSQNPNISSNGRFVSFQSAATNLIPNEPPPTKTYNYYVYDNTTETIERVNFNKDMNFGWSSWSAISNDGRYLVFEGTEGHWYSNDPPHLYIHDRQTGITELIDKAPDGTPGNSELYEHVYLSWGSARRSPNAITPNAEFVFFASLESNLVPQDNNGTYDVFKYDRVNKTIERVSLSSEGLEIAGRSYAASITKDASKIIFTDGSSLYLRNLNDDNDGDGYFPGVDDCNDEDFNINPGVPEIPYNSFDENCNGMSDDDDLDGDGYGIADDCDDNDGDRNPGQIEIPYNNYDENCSGMDDDDDLDDDGYGIAEDCNDNDSSIYPGATEVKHDGTDQDCNGYDLTIDITSAIYIEKDSLLTVKATSAWGETANLEVLGYGAMTWKDTQVSWKYDFEGANPGTVSVVGFEGSETSDVTVELK